MMLKFINKLLFFFVVVGVWEVSAVCKNDCNNREFVKWKPFYISTKGEVEDTAKHDFTYYQNSEVPKLGEYSPNVERVVFSQHGNARNGDDYYCYMRGAASIEGEDFRKLLIIAPQFYIHTDNYPTGTYYWDSSNGWKDGSKSTDNYSDRLSSYSMYDSIIYTLYNKSNYPNLKYVHMAGHSAGGQFMQRYAYSGRVFRQHHYSDYRMIVTNPSSYAYFDDQRPDLGDTNNLKCDNICDNTTLLRNPSPEQGYKKPSNTCSGDYNNWKYGIRNPESYTQDYCGDEYENMCVKSYPNYDVHYLLGEADTCNHDYCSSFQCNDHDLDTSCDGEDQGLCRLQRGLYFYSFLQQYYGYQVHSYTTVPNVGHDACLMFQSSEGRDLIF